VGLAVTYVAKVASVADQYSSNSSHTFEASLKMGRRCVIDCLQVFPLHDSKGNKAIGGRGEIRAYRDWSGDFRNQGAV